MFTLILIDNPQITSLCRIARPLMIMASPATRALRVRFLGG